MLLLRAGRTLADLSQEELAVRAGVSRQTLVKIESASRNVAKGVGADSIDKVRIALENSGIVFLPRTDGHGPGIALRIDMLTRSPDGSSD